MKNRVAKASVWAILFLVGNVPAVLAGVVVAVYLSATAIRYNEHRATTR